MFFSTWRRIPYAHIFLYSGLQNRSISLSLEIIETRSSVSEKHKRGKVLMNRMKGKYLNELALN
jgi:hypothetical protein